MSHQPLKIALAHDYLREYGGAERVLEVLHQMFPEAPCYTAFVDKEAMGKNWARFADWQIHQSSLTRFPFYKRLFSPMRIFAKWAFEQFDLSEYDVVISSSNAYFAKAIRVPKGKHICYCHTPPRVLYGYSAKSNWRSRPLLRMAGNFLNHFVRQMDFVAGQNPDVMIANSKETQLRIKKFYSRDSVVIHPPIAVFEQAEDFFKNLSAVELLDFGKRKQDSYFLYVNRLALAKHPELAVQAATRLNLPLKVVGDGAMLEDLKKIAGPNVEFLGAVDDEQLQELYRDARALLYPVEDEDFGMVPVEAMAWGTPVIAHASGGPLETIKEGVSGLFFKELSEEGLVGAMEKFQAKENWDQSKIHQTTSLYSAQNFKKRLNQLVFQS
jgi:glycosyltransferase involved in cell wall biosynthesis